MFIQIFFIRIRKIDCSIVPRKDFAYLSLGAIPFTGWNMSHTNYIYDEFRYYDFFDWIGLRHPTEEQKTNAESPKGIVPGIFLWEY